MGVEAFKGREEKVAKLEEEIKDSMRENRIIPETAVEETTKRMVSKFAPEISDAALLQLLGTNESTDFSAMTERLQAEVNKAIIRVTKNPSEVTIATFLQTTALANLAGLDFDPTEVTKTAAREAYETYKRRVKLAGGEKLTWWEEVYWHGIMQESYWGEIGD